MPVHVERMLALMLFAPMPKRQASPILNGRRLTTGRTLDGNRVSRGTSPGSRAALSSFAQCHPRENPQRAPTTARKFAVLSRLLSSSSCVFIRPRCQLILAKLYSSQRERGENQKAGSHTVDRLYPNCIEQICGHFRPRVAFHGMMDEERREEFAADVLSIIDFAEKAIVPALACGNISMGF